MFVFPALVTHCAVASNKPSLELNLYVFLICISLVSWQQWYSTFLFGAFVKAQSCFLCVFFYICKEKFARKRRERKRLVLCVLSRTAAPRGGVRQTNRAELVRAQVPLLRIG